MGKRFDLCQKWVYAVSGLNSLFIKRWRTQSALVHIYRSLPEAGIVPDLRLALFGAPIRLSTLLRYYEKNDFPILETTLARYYLDTKEKRQKRKSWHTLSNSLAKPSAAICIFSGLLRWKLVKVSARVVLGKLAFQSWRGTRITIRAPPLRLRALHGQTVSYISIAASLYLTGPTVCHFTFSFRLSNIFVDYMSLFQKTETCFLQSAVGRAKQGRRRTGLRLLSFFERDQLRSAEKKTAFCGSCWTWPVFFRAERIF